MSVKWDGPSLAAIVVAAVVVMSTRENMRLHRLRIVPEKFACSIGVLLYIRLENPGGGSLNESFEILQLFISIFLACKKGVAWVMPTWKVSNCVQIGAKDVYRGKDVSREAY
jgi:hypothetical protein